jgi:hypothetical protein
LDPLRGLSQWEPRRNCAEVIVNYEEVSIVHLNKQLLLGRVGRKGAELRYNAKGTQTCTLVVEMDKPGADGQVYT